MEGINETTICVLVEDQVTKKIVVNHHTILNSIANTIATLRILCRDDNSSIEEIVSFIDRRKELDQLTGNYKYCTSLKGAYQTFSVDKSRMVNHIREAHKSLNANYKLHPDTFDIEKLIDELKAEIIRDFDLWAKAFAISKMYQKCQEDKTILTFSHRQSGWSNPRYHLTPDFSMEIKTNFGYGSASYFYTKLKYKDIEITPFSDWIKYRFAKFSEIIRYSQWHNLENSEWLEAMNYAAEACNLSRDDENKFIEKYIIDECEEMVSELENILNKEEFEFRDQSKRTYTKNIKGHELIEFRGEKISGALDFINKILEYEHIVAVKTFIERIKACNKIIQPILANELLVIDIKLKKLLADAEELKPNYLVVVEKYNQYMTEKSKMQNQMIIDKEIDFKNIDVLKVKRAFLSKFPEYEVFEIEYKKIVSTYTTLLEQIENLKIVFENITTYNKNILLYFN